MRVPDLQARRALTLTLSHRAREINATQTNIPLSHRERAGVRVPALQARRALTLTLSHREREINATQTNFPLSHRERAGVRVPALQARRALTLTLSHREREINATQTNIPPLPQGEGPPHTRSTHRHSASRHDRPGQRPGIEHYLDGVFPGWGGRGHSNRVRAKCTSGKARDGPIEYSSIRCFEHDLGVRSCSHATSPSRVVQFARYRPEASSS